MQIVQTIVSLFQPSPQSSLEAIPVSSAGMIENCLKSIELAFKPERATMENQVWVLNRDEKHFEFPGQNEVRGAFLQAVGKGSSQPESIFNFQVDQRTADLTAQALAAFVNCVKFAVTYDDVQAPDFNFKLPRELKSSSAEYPQMSLLEKALGETIQAAARPLQEYYRYVDNESAYYAMLAGPGAF